MKVNVRSPRNGYYAFRVLSYRIFIHVYVPHIKHTTLGSIVMVCIISVPHRLSCLTPVSGAVWGDVMESLRGAAFLKKVGVRSLSPLPVHCLVCVRD